MITIIKDNEITIDIQRANRIIALLTALKNNVSDNWNKSINNEIEYLKNKCESTERL